MRLDVVWVRSLCAWVASRGLVLIFALNSSPELIANFYSPFIQHVATRPSLDPWTSWVNAGGADQAFPYGWPMVAVFWILGLTVFVTQDLIFGIVFGLLLVDLLALFAIHGLDGSWHEGSGNSSLYYASMPVVPASIMVAGSNDVIPMLLLFVAVWLVLRRHFFLGGALLGLAVGTKPLLLIALFAVALFVSRSAGRREPFVQLSFGSILALVTSFAPFLYSDGFRQAILSSGEISNALHWGIETSDGTLPLLPGIILVCSIMIWKLRRMNGDLLLVSTSLPVFLLAGLPNAPLGWVVWALPLITVAVSRLSPRLKLFGWIVLNFGIMAEFLNVNGDVLNAIHLSLVGSFSYLLWVELVRRNDLVKLLSRPALILIAGDSGVGKDTLADGLSRLLGRATTVHLSGDNYHKWDRGSNNWKYKTHLHPDANDLDRYFSDILELTSGRDVSVSHYDHTTGRTLPPKSSAGKEFVISSGLHALSSADVNHQASLKIFLSMSDDLRAQTKIARDTQDRGYSEAEIRQSIAIRKPDYENFVEPQSEEADLVFKSSAGGNARSIFVEFTSYAKPFDSDLNNQLMFGCGLDVTVSRLANGKRTVTVSGFVDPETLSSAFARVEPRIRRALGSISGWSEGAPGLIQLVTLVYLANLLKRDRLM